MRARVVFARFRSQRSALAGLIILAALCVLAFAGPLISPWEYDERDFTAFLQPPSASHPFGTTQTGGDVFTLTMRGMQKSLLIGALVALLATGLAAIVGATAGYLGGWADRALMWGVDLLLVIPSFLIIAILSPGLASKSWLLLVVLIAAFLWMISARMVRGATVSLREKEFVLAARYMGVGNRQIVTRHIVPNIASLLIVDATINVSAAIIAETGLSYFGFGVQPPDVSLGTLIADGTTAATTHAWLFAFPAALLVITVLAVNLVGDGLREALDPTSGETSLTTAVLTVRDLTVTYAGEAGDVHAVRGIDLDLRRGEVVGLAGESGCGKSATALALTGLLPATAGVGGSVKLGDQELLGLDDDELSAVRGSRISIVFQDPQSALTPVYTIGDQVAEAVRAHSGISREAARERAVELLDVVGIPDARARARAYPHEISGGQRQRVMIAIAIAQEPDVIVADEPTTALDVTVQAQVLDVLRSARDLTGAAILMISHDLALLAGFADRMAVMYAGRIVEQAGVDGLFTAPRMPYTAGLLGAIPRVDGARDGALTAIEGAPPALTDLPPGCPFAPRCPLAIEVCRTSEPRLERVASPPVAGAGDPKPGIALAACHRAGELASGALGPPRALFPSAAVPRAPAATPDAKRGVVLEVEDLVRHHPLLKGAVVKKEIGTVRAVDGVSFTLHDGETLGLVGESGCGKTSTLMELLELERPQSGRIVVLGHATEELSPGERRSLRRELSVVFQDPFASLDPRMPVGDAIAEPLRAHGEGGAAGAARVEELLELVGLEPALARRYPRQLSGGQRQRVAIARAIALEPRIVLLDEPVSALDVSIQAGIINLLAELRDRLGLSLLLVAHDLAIVRHVADRVAVMHLGRIVELGAVEDVFSAPAHPYTRALLAAIPIPDPQAERARERIVLSGEPESPVQEIGGCSFRTRCPLFASLGDAARRPCVENDPLPAPVGEGRQAACHHAARR